MYLVVAYGAIFLGMFAYIFKLASDSGRLQQQLSTLEEAQAAMHRRIQSAGADSLRSAD